MTPPSWKLPGELTQHEMDVAFDSLERVDYPAPFGEGYYWSKATCLIDMRIGSGIEPNSYHFVAFFHRLTNTPEWLWPALDRYRQVLIEIDRKCVATNRGIGARQRNGPIVLVFGLIGAALEHGQRVNVGAVPTIGEPVYSVVRLEAFDESTMRRIELVAGSPGVGPLLRAITDRELDSTAIGGHAAVPGQDEFPRHLAKRSPIVASNVEYLVDNVVGKVSEIWHIRDLEDVIATLGVAISPQACVVFRIGESFREVSLKRCQMVVTPPEFGHRRGQ